jgi:PAS domain S-box-containing protein/diguanylate cyclase (GGDEF)-like protein
MTAPTLRMLLAEDNPADAEIQLRELRRAGLRLTNRVVDTAEGFTAALHQFSPDIILSDFAMPGFDGMEALRLARELAPQTPFIFVSGTLGEEYAIRALKNGATDYVVKSNIARLPAAVERALAEAEAMRERRRTATELEIARERLVEREAGLNRAQQMARFAHIITGEDGGFESWSDTLPALLALEPFRMPGSTREWLEMLHPDDRDRFRKASVEAATTGKRKDVEYRLQRGDSEWIDVRQVMEPLAARHGARPNGARWFSTLQDVTEQKRAEQKLRESESLKSAILEASLDGLITIDIEGRIVEFNPAAEAMFQLPREQALGKIMAELIIPPHLRDAHHRGIARYVETNQAPIFGKRLELEAMRSDGSVFPVELAVVPIHSGALPLFTGFIRDITARKEAEAKIKRLNRVYAVLSGINSLIVRAKTKDEIYQESCRIAVEQGEFRMAWLGVVDEAAERVNAVASAGEVRGFLDMAPLGRNTMPKGQGLAWTSILLKKPVISNDIQNDPQTNMKAQCLERGAHSLAMLPLAIRDKGLGVLALYAAEAGFFDDAEMKLLNELAGDIAFALDHIEQSERLDYLAYYDSLTGLANRALFRERLTQLAHASTESKIKLAVVAFDIEQFKSVNDSLGRQAGDLLLTQLSERLSKSAGDPTMLARLAADRFAIMLPVVQNEVDAARRVEELAKQCLATPFQIGADELRMTAKAGIAIFPDHGSHADALLENAEAALDKAKGAAEAYLFFEQGLTQRVAENLKLESKLRRAVERREFVLHYQPRVDLAKRDIQGVEALIRWQTAEGLVPPVKFIPLLEETGLIIEVGAWALQHAAVQHRQWLESGTPAPRIAVNVSAEQLRHKDFVSIVKSALQQGASQPGIDLEITESMLMEDVSTSIQKLREVRDLGVGVALDDFGTGYSSLGYLSKLPVTSLKIDRSFVITMLSDPSTMTLVTTMISLAHSLGLKVVAEGVDAEEQAKVLRELGCDEMQGYLFSKPLPADALLQLMRTGANEPVGSTTAVVRSPSKSPSTRHPKGARGYSRGYRTRARR